MTDLLTLVLIPKKKHIPQNHGNWSILALEVLLRPILYDVLPPAQRTPPTAQFPELPEARHPVLGFQLRGTARRWRAERSDVLPGSGSVRAYEVTMDWFFREHFNRFKPHEINGKIDGFRLRFSQQNQSNQWSYHDGRCLNIRQLPNLVMKNVANWEVGPQMCKLGSQQTTTRWSNICIHFIYACVYI